jgi:hypothetical protein
LNAQKNYFRYKSMNLFFRVGTNANASDLLRCLIASHVAKANVSISIDGDVEIKYLSLLEKWGLLKTENEEEAGISAHGFERAFVFGDNFNAFNHCCRSNNVHIFVKKPLLSSRIELLKVCREQSMSIDIHRYGNVPEKSISNLY